MPVTTNDEEEEELEEEETPEPDNSWRFESRAGWDRPEGTVAGQQVGVQRGIGGGVISESNPRGYDKQEQGFWGRASFGAANKPIQSMRTPQDLLDEAVDQRRAMIASGRDPDAPALGVNPHRAAQLNKEFNALTGARAVSARERTKETEFRFKAQKETRIQEGLSDLMNDFNTLQSRPGTPERHKEIWEKVDKNWEAANTPMGREMISEQMKLHDDKVDFDAKAPPGYKVGNISTDDTGKSRATFVPDVGETFKTKEDLVARYPDSKPRQNTSGAWYSEGQEKSDKTAKDPKTELDAEMTKRFGATADEILAAAKELKPTNDPKYKVDDAKVSVGGVKSDGKKDKMTVSPDDNLSISLPDGRVVNAKRSELVPYINRAMKLQGETPVGPAPGTTKTVGGVEVEWDGKGWRAKK